MNAAEKEHLQSFIRHLTTAATTASLYRLEHLQVLRLCRQALEHLNAILENHNSLTLKVIDGRLIVANKPVAQNLAVERLLDAMQRQKISFLKISQGIYSEELLSLIGALCKHPDHLQDVSDSEHLQYGQLELQYKKQTASSQRQLSLNELVSAEREQVAELYQSVHKREKPNIDGINNIVGSFINEFSGHSDAFLALAPLRSMDEYTYTHSTNICLLNLAQARLLGIEGALLNEIGIAAMLHDVGKMFIPPEILSKSDKLTEDEWDLMKQHPRLGAEYLLGTRGVPRLAVVTAYEHHMRYDGAGYPQTSRTWPQNVSSYMTAISDTFDAMRTHRAYEESLDMEEITRIMLNLAGNKLHPQLTHNFLQLIKQLDTASHGNT